MFSDEEFDIHKIVKEPLVVSENLETLELLKEFKENQGFNPWSFYYKCNVSLMLLNKASGKELSTGFSFKTVPT